MKTICRLFIFYIFISFVTSCTFNTDVKLYPDSQLSSVNESKLYYDFSSCEWIPVSFDKYDTSAMKDIWENTTIRFHLLPGNHSIHFKEERWYEGVNLITFDPITIDFKTLAGHEYSIFCKRERFNYTKTWLNSQKYELRWLVSVYFIIKDEATQEEIVNRQIPLNQE